MKLNSEIQIIGTKVILVPYRKKHVQRYHDWMENEELREQTASDRLSLEEEYAMQQSWLMDEQRSMIGDANLYINKDEGCIVGEIGLMIAEPHFRANGRGTEAAQMILRYGLENIGINKFNAIISSENKASVHLFEKLNFVKENVSEVFHEVTLSRIVDAQWSCWLKTQTKNYTISATEPNS